TPTVVAKRSTRQWMGCMLMCPRGRQHPLGERSQERRRAPVWRALGLLQSSARVVWNPAGAVREILDHGALWLDGSNFRPSRSVLGQSSTYLLFQIPPVTTDA